MKKYTILTIALVFGFLTASSSIINALSQDDTLKQRKPVSVAELPREITDAVLEEFEDYRITFAFKYSKVDAEGLEGTYPQETGRSERMGTEREMREGMNEGAERMETGREEMNEEMQEGAERMETGRENLRDTLQGAESATREGMKEGAERMETGREEMNEEMHEGAERMEKEGEEMHEEMHEGTERMETGRENLRDTLQGAESTTREGMKEGAERMETGREEMNEEMHEGAERMETGRESMEQGAERANIPETSEEFLFTDEYDTYYEIRLEGPDMKTVWYSEDGERIENNTESDQRR